MKKHILPDYVYNSLTLYSNTVIANNLVEKYGKNKILNHLKSCGFTCIMKENEHVINLALQKTEINYIVECI